MRNTLAEVARLSLSACLVMLPVAGIAHAQGARFVVDAGVAHFPARTAQTLAATALVQATLGGFGKTSVIGALGGSVKLEERSVPDGLGTQRIDFGTARLGLERPIVESSRLSLLASAAVAGSWSWFTRGGAGTIPGREKFNSGGFVGGIVGLRAKFGAPGAPGFSIRYEIRPWLDPATFNPYLGFGYAF